MDDLSIFLLGSPQIKRGDHHISIQRRKDLALFIYLIVTSQSHTRDTLATLLWPDSNQSTSRGNLRKSLSRLKSDLGDAVLLSMEDQVRLDPRLSHRVDVQYFQSLIKQTGQHKHTLIGNDEPLCSVCEAALEEAVKLYRGEFIQGFTLPDSPIFEEWQFFQTEGYRQSLAEALQFLMQQNIHNKKYSLAIEHGRKWLEMDRLHEPAHRQLMLAYALSGQQSAALRQFDECVRLLKDEIGIDPEPETIELNEAIRKKTIRPSMDKQNKRGRSQKKIRPAESRLKSSQKKINHNLPLYLTTFLGRRMELDNIKQSIEDSSCRILTLLGPGGSGKTRLAAQTGYIFSNENTFKDGILFIQLAPLTEPGSIIAAIQNELNIPNAVKNDDSRQQLFNYLSNRQMLLILDNLEHLLDADTVTLAADIVRNAPQIKVLITSRERLNIQGETIFPVGGLETPPNESLLSTLEADPDTTSFGAIQLFEQSARRVQPSFRITRQNIGVISQICTYVRGMPLAIELAASWIEVLPIEEINHEIKQSLDFLQSEMHGIPDRQRSLRAVFDSSWIKLNKHTRSTIKALSVFRSPFSREAAQAITGMTAKTLLELTNKSWIQRQAGDKYQIHELLRQFAYEKLESDTVTFDQIREKYCSYYGKYLSVLWEMMKGPDQSRAFSELEVEFENVRTAWTWSAARGEFENSVYNMLPVLFGYSEIRGKSLDFMDMCQRMLNKLEQSDQIVNRDKLEFILRAAYGAFWFDGHPVRYGFFEGIYPIYEEGIQKAWSIFQSKFQMHELGFWGIILTFVYGYFFDSKKAIDQLRKAIPGFERYDTPWELANLKLHLARLLLSSSAEKDENTTGNIHQLLTEALDIFTSIGDKTNSGQTIQQIGNLRMSELNPTGAIRQWKSARANLLSVDVNDWAAASSINWQIGDAHLQLGQFDDAFKNFQEISKVNLEHGFIQQAVGALSKESFERSRYGDLDDAIRIRQKCLELIKDLGPEYQIAWNIWEMGELLRLANKLAEAAQWFDRANEIFEKQGDNVGKSFYWRGTGDLALARMDFDSARQCFERSRNFAIQAHHNWALAYSLNGFSKAEYELKNIEASEESLREALALAREVHDPGITLTILANMANLFAHKDQTKPAAELGSMVVNHFASWNETKSQATDLLSSLKSRLLPREFKDLKRKGQSMDLWETVDQLVLKSY